MYFQRRFTTLILLTITVLVAASRAGNLDLSLQKEVEHTVIRGLHWLADQQEEDGSWQHYPAITALVLSAFMRSHPAMSADDSLPAAGYAFLEQCVRPDGGIYVDDMGNYNTSICLIALQDARDLRFTKLINNARRYLLNMQLDEDRGYTRDSLYYGGLGYATKEKPADISNLQWALEAMYRTDPGGSETSLEKLPAEERLFWKRAVVFLQRCQNYRDENSPDYAGDDGGFMYKPGYSKAGGTRSYGSMTYAGLKSMIYARLTAEDPRVQAVREWMSRNWDLKQNPGMGQEGLFYYYHTLAKALNALGAEKIRDEKGVSHSWREELIRELVARQDSSGFWINANGRWWENNPVLVTAYVLLALEEAAGLPGTFSALPAMERKNSR